MYNKGMTTINIQQKKYNTWQKKHQLILPMNYEVIIPENDSVRLLSQITEEMDYTELYKAYSSEGRNPATDPKIMFVLVITLTNFTPRFKESVAALIYTI